VIRNVHIYLTKSVDVEEAGEEEQQQENEADV